MKKTIDLTKEPDEAPAADNGLASKYACLSVFALVGKVKVVDSQTIAITPDLGGAVITLNFKSVRHMRVVAEKMYEVGVVGPHKPEEDVKVEEEEAKAPTKTQAPVKKAPVFAPAPAPVKKALVKKAPVKKAPTTQCKSKRITNKKEDQMDVFELHALELEKMSRAKENSDPHAHYDSDDSSWGSAYGQGMTQETKF